MIVQSAFALSFDESPVVPGLQLYFLGIIAHADSTPPEVAAQWAWGYTRRVMKRLDVHGGIRAQYEQITTDKLAHIDVRVHPSAG